MYIVKSIDELNKKINKLKSSGKTIGYVPTMGYLHEGHLSLVRKARANNDIVVVSIFVNPKQFGENEDLDKYPSDFAKDSALCESESVDILFHPNALEMYPSSYNTYVETFGEMTNKLCGASREGHFRGVNTVLAKFFNIVKPNNAYFGQKDAQQVAVVKKMVKDLNYDINIVACPIVREESGLALSSRNAYLSEEEKREALVLNQSINYAKNMIESGETNVDRIKNQMKEIINKSKLADIDYIEIVNFDTLEQLDVVKGNVLIAIAVKIGNTRLIDNVSLNY